MIGLLRRSTLVNCQSVLVCCEHLGVAQSSTICFIVTLSMHGVQPTNSESHKVLHATCIMPHDIWYQRLTLSCGMVTSCMVMQSSGSIGRDCWAQPSSGCIGVLIVSDCQHVQLCDANEPVRQCMHAPSGGTHMSRSQLVVQIRYCSSAVNTVVIMQGSNQVRKVK